MTSESDSTPEVEVPEQETPAPAPGPDAAASDAAAPDAAASDAAAPDTAAPDAEAPEAQAQEAERAESDLARQLAERTADLQRLQAEYVNYKRRVDRDREVQRVNAQASVLASFLPVLDDIGRARDHGELEGGFKAVADSLVQATTAHGLETFGKIGDVFDPMLHEALMHRLDAEAPEGEPTVDAIMQVGYRIGDKVLRPARVAVVERDDAAPAAE